MNNHIEFLFLLFSVIIITYFSLLIAAPPLKLIDLPGLDQRIVDDSMVSWGTAWCLCHPNVNHGEFHNFLLGILVVGKHRFIIIFSLSSYNLFFSSLCKIGEHAQHNDAILLVVVPASQASEISSSRALKIAKEYDPESEYIGTFIIETLHHTSQPLWLLHLD